MKKKKLPKEVDISVLVKEVDRNTYTARITFEPENSIHDKILDELRDMLYIVLQDYLPQSRLIDTRKNLPILIHAHNDPEIRYAVITDEEDSNIISFLIKILGSARSPDLDDQRKNPLHELWSDIGSDTFTTYMAQINLASKRIFTFTYKPK